MEDKILKVKSLIDQLSEAIQELPEELKGKLETHIEAINKEIASLSSEEEDTSYIDEMMKNKNDEDILKRIMSPAPQPPPEEPQPEK